MIAMEYTQLPSIMLQKLNFYVINHSLLYTDTHTSFMKYVDILCQSWLVGLKSNYFSLRYKMEKLFQKM